MNILKMTTENAAFQVIESLKRNREKRNKQGQSLVEGVRCINNAIEYKWHIIAFVYCKERKLSTWASEIIRTHKADTHYEVSDAILKKLSDKEEPSELLAVVEIPDDDFSRIPIRDDLLIVVFDRPVSPGNLGSIIRSCDAMGAHGLIVTGYAADVYDPETVRASTGSLFALPVIRKPSHKELLPWFTEIKEHVGDLQIVGTDENSAVNVFDLNLTRPMILLAGNETKGLSAAYKELADAMVKIPMQGSASSMNVAAATSICLYEITRQRKNHDNA